ncbi:MAG TPA: hypothetical protein VJM78_07035 [Rhizomicrobium sp.]|nr:hypothetical protein [Rhizomicrobium sp.]
MTTIFSLERVKRRGLCETMAQSGEERLIALLRALLPADAYAMRGADGAPDIIVCHQGRVLGLELKGRTESYTEAQAQTFPKLRDAGMRIETVRDPDSALGCLRAMGVQLKEEARHAVRDSYREETRRKT